MENITKAPDVFAKLVEIMDELRQKCPWDKEQTLESIRHLTIEETYELSDAILNNDLPSLKKELGDILLHVVFYSKIASETQAFSITDVIESLNEKLIRRHPHIYGNVEAENTAQVIANWEQIKLKEGNKSVLGGVPNSMPALVKAFRIQEKAAGVGFDWQNTNEVLDKVQEEVYELKAEIVGKNTIAIEEEFGDLLFALVNLSRFLNINPDDALEKANKKFVRRFQAIESMTATNNKNMKDLSIDEMNELWEQVKMAEKNK